MSKQKLLLADDSITIQKVVNLTFADEGIDVISVGDGNTAMDKIREESPDLIMADVNMPGLNGYEICEKIKQSDTGATTPVILLVGSFEPFDEVEAKRVGADDYLTKPFQSINQLVNTVNVLINSESFPKPDATAAEFAASAGSNGSESDTYELPAQPPVFDDSGIDDEMIEADQVGGETESAFTPVETHDESEGFDAGPVEKVSESGTAEHIEESAEGSGNEIPGFAFVEQTQTFEFVVEESVDEEVQELESVDEEESQADYGDAGTEEFEEISGESVDLTDTAESGERSGIELDDLNLLEIPVIETEDAGGDYELAADNQEEPAESDFEVLPSDEPDSFGDEVTEASSDEVTEEFSIASEESGDYDAAAETNEEQSRIDVSSEEFIEEVSRRVVEHLSDGAIRDVAREVVPEMAERIIRETAEEKMRE